MKPKWAGRAMSDIRHKGSGCGRENNYRKFFLRNRARELSGPEKEKEFQKKKVFQKPGNGMAANINSTAMPFSFTHSLLF